MSGIDDLNKALSDLKASSGDIEACAVVAEDGLMMASSLPQGVEEARVAAMAAAMLTISSRTMTELKRARLKQLFLSGDEGYVVIMQAGPRAGADDYLDLVKPVIPGVLRARPGPAAPVPPLVGSFFPGRPGQVSIREDPPVLRSQLSQRRDRL